MAKWIKFVLLPQDKNRKTQAWQVQSTTENHVLGLIAWYAPWRQYSFHPSYESVYERQCLRDIAQFCEDQTKAYRNRPK